MCGNRFARYELRPSFFYIIRGKETCGDIDILLTRPNDDGKTHSGLLYRSFISGIWFKGRCFQEYSYYCAIDSGRKEFSQRTWLSRRIGMVSKQHIVVYATETPSPEGEGLVCNIGISSESCNDDFIIG